MTVRKKKATFYLPEDLLRATRVHAARTDKRESQVVEEALRAHLGYGAAEEAWERALGRSPERDAAGARIEHTESDAPPASEPQAVAPESDEPASTEPDGGSADQQPPGEAPAEPLADLLDPTEAVAVAVAELHALRAEGDAGRP